MAYIKNIGSTFGIDIRRKIYVPGDYVSDWLKGEIDPSYLKNIAWSFEEKLTSATDQYGKAYDELTAGLREALKTFTKLLRGVGSGKSNDSISSESGDSKSTQSALMEAAGAIAAFTSSSVDDSVLAEAFMIAPKYNIPARTSVPIVKLPFTGGGIKVNFSYGKAGLFNARLEVYEPIRNIMNSLAPAFKGGKYDGLLSVDAGNTIPFEFQSKYYFIKSAASALTDGTGSTTIKNAVKKFTEATKSITTVAKEAAGIQVKIEKEKSIQSKAEDKILDQIEELGEKAGDSTVGGILSRDQKPRNYKGWHPIIGARIESALNSWAKAEKNLSGYDRAEGKREAAKFSDVPLSQKDQVKDRYDKGSLYYKKAEVLDKVSESGGDITSVLAAIATIRPKLVGRATKDQLAKVSQAEKTFKMMLVGGDGGNVYFNVDDIVAGVGEKGPLYPLLQITGIPMEVEASFDYSNVDENGYPMAGTIVIKKIWSVRSYGEAVKMKE